MQTNVVLTKFLSKFTTIDFFKEIVNVCLYPSDFSVTVGSNDQSSVPVYLNTFFRDLSKLLNQYGHDNRVTADKLIDASRTILKLRSAGKGLITYDTIDQHFTATNAVIKKLIDSAVTDRVNTDDTFRFKIDNIVTNIDYFYDMQHAICGMTQIHDFLEKVDRPETSIIEAVEQYKDLSLQLNADLSNLSTVARDETATDYYMLSDTDSVSQISKSITNYIFDNYSFFKSGLEAYDESVDGFEASSVHIIASPSNGGKSMTLANLFYKIAQHNKDDFEVGDAAIYITCEDDIIKTTRKFMSIFGNYDFNNVRNIYKQVHLYFSNLKKSKASSEELLSAKQVVDKLFSDILNTSIVQTTKGNLKVAFKYSPENTLSAGDIQKQIAKFKMQGINVKYIIIDYLDVLKPTLLPSGFGGGFDDYNTLGLITQELRTLSRLYGLPVITATQTVRDGDNVSVGLSNGLIGESWKKVKYSDFIYMQRIRDELDIFSDEVSRYVFREECLSTDPRLIAIQEQMRYNLKPIEMRVTKSKEKGKGYCRFMLFCTQNLRIYNYVDEYLKDMYGFEPTNRKLLQRVRNSIDLSSVNTAMTQLDPMNDENNDVSQAWGDPAF